MRANAKQSCISRRRSARSLLEQHLDYLIDGADEIAWDPRSEAVVAHRVRRLGALVLAEQPLRGCAERTRDRAMLAGHPRARPALPAVDAGPRTMAAARVAAARAVPRSPATASEWPDVSDAGACWRRSTTGWRRGSTASRAASSSRGWTCAVPCTGCSTGTSSDGSTNLRRRTLSYLVAHASQSTIPAAAPALAVRLQEVFGWMDSPRIAGGRVPVTLQLLSPARRPVQVTRDLASFWARGYVEVRKELKGPLSEALLAGRPVRRDGDAQSAAARAVTRTARCTEIEHQVSCTRLDGRLRHCSGWAC